MCKMHVDESLKDRSGQSYRNASYFNRNLVVVVNKLTTPII